MRASSRPSGRGCTSGVTSPRKGTHDRSGTVRPRPITSWTEGLLPEWLRLVPDRQATEAVWSMMLNHLDEYEPLVRLAVEHYQD
jgi:myo-inositol catabolism protein IolC